LEARWAVFFDTYGLLSDYEPEGFALPELYLPDFWLPQVHMWAEVKPERIEDIDPAAIEKLRKLVLQSGYGGLVLDGPPDEVNYWAIMPGRLDDSSSEDWYWNDFLLTEGHDYPFSEHRFYGSTGVGPFMRERREPISEAVYAARAARFSRSTPCTALSRN